jgi:hypothetical protein
MQGGEFGEVAPQGKVGQLTTPEGDVRAEIKNSAVPRPLVINFLRCRTCMRSTSDRGCVKGSIMGSSARSHGSSRKADMHGVICLGEIDGLCCSIRAKNARCGTRPPLALYGTSCGSFPINAGQGTNHQTPLSAPWSAV